MRIDLQPALALAPALAAGFVLGGVFFGGLWWTVRKGLTSPRPALWFGFSLLVRLGLVLAGFYFVAGGSGLRFLACMAGFVVARLAAVRLIRERDG